MKVTFKSCLAAALLVLAGQSVSAQRLDLTWGKPLDAGRKRSVIDIIGQDNTGFYTLVKNTKGKDKLMLEHCDNNANEVYSNELTFPSPDGKETKYEGLKKAGDHFFLFTSYYNKSQDKNYAFYTKVNLQGTPDKSFEKIDEISAEKKRNSGGFSIVSSKDSSKILVYHDEPYEKNEPEKFNFKVYDRNMKLLWEKFVELPYKDKDIAVSDFTVSNNGRVYLLAKYQVGNRDKKNGHPNYNYFILSYNGTDTKYKEYTVSLGDQFISDITFDIEPKGNLLCAGFYSNKNADGIAGTFYIRIDGENAQVLASKIQEFDQATLAKFMRSGRAKRKKELASFVMRKPIVREDGGIVLVAEQYYVIVTSTSDKYGNTSYTYHYYYNTIVVANLNPDGSIAWVSAIPKVQHSINDDGYYSSYALCVYKDKMYFVYNDNKKNIGITTTGKGQKKLKQCIKLKKAQAVVAVMDNSGNLSKTVLMDNKDKEAKHMYIRPKMALQASANSLIIVGQKRNDYRYGVVKFD